MYPTPHQEQQMLLHCAQARYIWNLAVEQRSFWARHKGPTPGYVELARQLTEARAVSDWLREGNAEIQQQALRDFDQAVTRHIRSGFGKPTWRKRYRHEGFRVIGTDRVPAFEVDGAPKLNTRGKQVKSRLVRVERLNRRWARVNVPGCGLVRLRLAKGRGCPEAKTFRVIYRNGQWHAGRTLNCPQLTAAERARYRKHQRRAARAPKNSDSRAAEYAQASKLKAKEVARRRDWVEKTSTMLATEFDVIRFEKLNIKNMTATAKGTMAEPGRNVAAKAGLNRALLAQGWGALRTRTGQKAPGRVEDVPAPYTSLRCSSCGWIEKRSRKSQAEFSCVSCGFACNADLNAAINIAAGHAGGTTPLQRVSVREPQPATVEILPFEGEEDVKGSQGAAEAVIAAVGT
jgi:putative transposase